MIIGGAYQPAATRTLDEITELEREARELFDAHRLDLPNAGTLSANDLSRLAILLDQLDELGMVVWRTFILPDWSETWRTLAAAQNATKIFARHLHALQAKDTGEAALVS